MSNLRSISEGSFVLGDTNGLTFEAGSGIKISEPSEGTVRIANDETVLFSGTASGQNTIQLSESLLNFERVKIWMRSNADASNPVSIVEYPTSQITDTLVIFLTDRFSTVWLWITWRYDYSITNSGTTLTETSNAYGGLKTNNTWSSGSNVNDQVVYKVVGINRISGGNA